MIEATGEPTTWLLVTEVMNPSHPDPLPGDFDEELTDVDPADLQVVEPSRENHLVVQFTLDGDDAAALQKIASDQGEKPTEVVRALIGAASARAA